MQLAPRFDILLFCFKASLLLSELNLRDRLDERGRGELENEVQNCTLAHVGANEEK